MPICNSRKALIRRTGQPAQTAYYDVQGATLQDVMGQLDPVEWGRCTWNFTYTYSADSSGSATRVNITLRLTIRLPRWTGRGYQRASQNVKNEWNRMLTALRTHENGHADIARRWAPTMKQRLLNQPEGDLPDLYRQAQADHDAEQAQYDSTTSHGQTQGVSLDTSIR